MLFNSYEFLIFFLPLVLVVFFRLGRYGYYRASITWLVISSLFFYGWWNPGYLILIISSILLNYGVGTALTRVIKKKSVLILGITINLLLLGYYKYGNFILTNAYSIYDYNGSTESIILPLAISFFTFQQISYLVDTYKGVTEEHNFLHYCLFVVFFPQLIAGPIVHHNEMLPQFSQRKIYRFFHENFSVGLTILVIGLVKKVLIADSLSAYASPIFAAAEKGYHLSFVEAWIGALSYTFQLYFDFSGYSDMAIGIARLFGIKLPLNFNSPYKALNITEFWKRWHMTLSRFLKDYLYIPLGGNRKGKSRRYLNLAITMVLGGLWHGAGWTFVAWGALHGFYLIVNHGWHYIINKMNLPLTNRRFFSPISWLLTFVAVIVSWVIFRANTFHGAIQVLKGMMGLNGFVLPQNFYNDFNGLFGLGEYMMAFGVQFGDVEYVHGYFIFFILPLLLVFVLLGPNTQEFMGHYKPALIPKGQSLSYRWAWIAWRPNFITALVLSLIAMFILIKMTGVSEFLYFQF
ncbi:MAG: alginate O-acetylation protein [bacterium]|nr:MAG: alginate O-acetylation protein [bacterium]